MGTVSVVPSGSKRIKEIKDVERVEIVSIKQSNSNKDIYLIRSYRGSQLVDTTEISRKDCLDVEINGDTGSLEVGNVVYINGNVLKAYAENNLRVEGIVKQIKNAQRPLVVDKDLRVTFGLNRVYQSQYEGLSSKRKRKIIRLDGVFTNVKANVDCVDVYGRVGEVKACNSIFIKGNVEIGGYGNNGSMTAGKVKGINYKKLIIDKNKQLDDLSNVFGSILRHS